MNPNDRVKFTLGETRLTGSVTAVNGDLAEVVCDIPEGASHAHHIVTVRVDRLEKLENGDG